MSEETQKKEPGLYKRATKNMSVFGGARSLMGNAREGGAVIGEGVRVLNQAARDSMKAGRFETFDQAMSRLGIEEEQLPIIHNQMVLQLYLTFFVGIASLTSGVNLVVQDNLFAAIIAALIAVASMTKTVQSSMQCEFIRQRRLGIGAMWWSRPSIWFPARMEGTIPMAANDPMRDPKLVRNLAVSSQLQFKLAAASVAMGLGAYAVFMSMGWPLITMGAAMVFLMKGANLSFEVYKRRQGHHCDLYPWLMTPSSWIPAKSVKTTKSKKLVMTAANDDRAQETP
jgi:hypothetical protein